MTSPQYPVSISAGGVYYETTISTLSSQPTRHGVFANVNKQGCIFVDRDGMLFSYILNYLRTGVLVYDSNDEVLRKLLLLEAKYFGLDKLADCL